MSNTDTGDPIIQQKQENISSTARESLILAAINFLQNPNVRHSPLQQKQKFLRSKGLTEDEIQIACEKAGVFTVDPNSTVISMDISASSSSAASSSHHHHPHNSHNHYQLVQKPSMFTRIRDILNSVALFGSLAYVCYMFYKRFIEPFLFGRKRKKTIEETIKEMNDKIETQIKDINHEMINVREEIKNLNQNDAITREISNFKSDLDAIKGLLLNRKQFANPLSVLPPSIPAWQLTSQSHHHHTEAENEQDKNDDAGSGSGSSETEVVTKNSDSSLEIM